MSSNDVTEPAVDRLEFILNKRSPRYQLSLSQLNMSTSSLPAPDTASSTASRSGLAESASWTLGLGAEGSGLPSECEGLVSGSTVSSGQFTSPGDLNEQLPSTPLASPPGATLSLPVAVLSSVCSDTTNKTVAGSSTPDLRDVYAAKCRETIDDMQQRIRAARSLNTETGDRLAREYQTELETLQQCQLEQLETVQVAIKCEISTVLSRFGVKMLTDIVKKTNEDLVRDNMSKFTELIEEMEKNHRTEINDLRSSYQEQMRLLHEQLTTANELHVQYVDELKSEHTTTVTRHRIEQENLTLKISQLEASSATLRQQLNSLQQQLTADINDLTKQHNKQTTNMAAQLETLQNKLTTENETRVRLEQELSELRHELESTNERLLAATGSVDAYQQHLETVEELQELRDMAADQQTQIDELTEVLEARDNELGKLQDQLEARDNELGKLQDQFEARDNELGKLQDQLEARDNELGKLQDQFEARDNELGKLQDQLEARDNELGKLQDQFEARDNELGKLQDQFEARDNELGKLQDQLEARNGEVHVLQQQLASYDRNISKLQEKVSHLEPEVERLLKQEVKYVAEMDELKEHYKQLLTTEHNELEQCNANCQQKDVELQMCKAMIDELRTSAATGTGVGGTVGCGTVGTISGTGDAVDGPINTQTLLTSLRLDLERTSAERDAVQQTNSHLLSILSESVRTTVDLETRILQCLANFDVPVQSPRTPTQPPTPSGDHRQHVAGQDTALVSAAAAAFSPRDPRHQRLSAVGADDLSSTLLPDTLSLCSDEGLDVSQRFTEAMFSTTGTGIDSDTEEMVTDLSCRLQRSVERLLDRLVDAGRQIQDGRRIEMELRQMFRQSEQTVEEWTSHADDLEQQLKQETATREFLSIEFYKADGLVKGYVSEKHATDECIRSLENKNELLIVEMEKLQARVMELEEGHDDLFHREQDLAQQRQTLALSVDNSQIVPASHTVEGLLQDNTRLSEELRKVSKQMERDRQELSQQVVRLELTTNDLRSQLERAIDDRRLSDDDHQQKIESLEKQLKADKQFIEYQATEREQERDEFLQKVSHLESIIRDRDKKENVSERLRTEITDLEELLHEKVENYEELELIKLRLEADNETQLATITELRDIIQHLETDLNDRCNTLKQQVKRCSEMESEVADVHELNQKLMDELNSRPTGNTATDATHLQRLVRDLEEQLEAAGLAEVQAQQRIRQLEEELKNLRSLEQELMQDRDALQKQVCDQLKQLSHLRSQVDDLTLTSSAHQHLDDLVELKAKVSQLNDALEVRDKEVSDLSEQLTQFQERLLDQTEELQHTVAQLDVQRQECDNISTVAQQQIQQLTDNNQQLQFQIVSLQDRVDSTPMSTLTQTLLTEKNNEIDELTTEVDRLQSEVDRLTNELESVQSQSTLPAQPQLTEHLHSVSIEAAPAEHFVLNYEQTIETLRDKLQQNDFELCQMQEVVAEADKHKSQMTDLLTDKQLTIEQLKAQRTSLLKEIDSLNEAFSNLQDDYSQVESMAKNKQKQIESCTDEITQLRLQLSDVQEKNELDMKQISKQLTAKQNIINEQEETIYELNARLENQQQTEPTSTGVAGHVTAARSQPGQVETGSERGQVEGPVAELSELHRKLETDCSVLRTELEQVHSELDKSELGRRAALEKLNDLRSQLETTQAERVKLLSQVELLESERDVTNNKCVELDATVQQLQQQQLTAVNTILQQQQQQQQQQQHDANWPAMSDVCIDATCLDGLSGSVPRRDSLNGHQLSSDEDVEQATNTLHRAVQHNIDIDTHLLELAGISGPLSTILSKLHCESLEVLSLSDVEFLRQLHRQSDIARQPSSTDTAEMATNTTLNDSHRQVVDVTALQAAWNNEKQSLLASITGLKTLLVATTTTTTTTTPSVDDWRADMLRAVHDVLTRDLEVVHADLDTYTLTHSAADSSHVLDALERTISAQESMHRDAIHLLINADRQSLAMEFNDLRAENVSLQHELQAAHDQCTLDSRQAEHRLITLQHQYKLQVDSLKTTCDNLQRDLMTEREHKEQLTAELNCQQQNVSVSRSKSQQLAQLLEQTDSQLQAARLAVEEQQRENAQLAEQLANSQSELRDNAKLKGQLVGVQRENVQLKEQLTNANIGTAEFEKQLVDVDRENVQLKEQLAQLNRENAQLREQVISMRREEGHLKEQLLANESSMKVVCNQLAEATQQQSIWETELTNEKQSTGNLQDSVDTLQEQLTQLRAALDVERSDKDELTNNLLQLQKSLDVERHRCQLLNSEVIELRHSMLKDEQSITSNNNEIVDELRAALDVERSGSLELSTCLEQERERTSQQLTELSQLNQQLTAECQQLHTDITLVTHQNQELSRQLHSAGYQLSSLEQELSAARSKDLDNGCQQQQITQLEHQLQTVKSRLESVENHLADSKHEYLKIENQLKDSEQERLRFKNLLNDSERERVKVENQLKDSEREHLRVENQLKDSECEHLRIENQLKDNDQERLKVENRLKNREQECLRVENQLKDSECERMKVENLLKEREQRLKQQTSQHSKETVRSMEFAGDHIAVDRTVQLSRVQTNTQSDRQTDIDTQTYRHTDTDTQTYRQTREHEETRQQLLTVTVELTDARSQLLQLKTELNRTHLELQDVRQQLQQQQHQQLSSSDADKQKIQRLYAKYLRAESFRKALIYQKKYLLLLIGGFRDCEDETLAMIARMGVDPSDNSPTTTTLRPLSRFRSAVRVVIAISRLKFVVRKWHRVMPASSSSQTVTTATHAMNGLPSQSRETRHVTDSNDMLPLTVTSRQTGRHNVPSTPPTRDRRPINKPLSVTSSSSQHLSLAAETVDSSSSLNEYIRRLEGLQAKLGHSGSRTASAANWPSNMRR